LRLAFDNLSGLSHCLPDALCRPCNRRQLRVIPLRAPETCADSADGAEAKAAVQMMLVKLFIQTDPTVLPIGLVLSLISNLASLAFLEVLIVFFAIRYIP
jgi:hypothetical protein